MFAFQNSHNSRILKAAKGICKHFLVFIYTELFGKFFVWQEEKQR